MSIDDYANDLKTSKSSVSYLDSSLRRQVQLPLGISWYTGSGTTDPNDLYTDDPTLYFVYSGGWHQTAITSQVRDRYNGVTVTLLEGGPIQLYVQAADNVFSFIQNFYGAPYTTSGDAKSEELILSTYYPVTPENPRSLAVEIPAPGTYKVVFPFTTDSQAFVVSHSGAGSYRVSQIIPRRAVQAYDIDVNSIKAYHVTADLIDTISLRVSNSIVVGPDLIGAKSIDGSKIVDGTLSGVLIANGTVTGNKVLAGTISGVLITANSITGSNIAANTITADKVTASFVDTISAQVSNSLVVGSGQIADKSIDGRKIVDGTVSGVLIRDGTVTGNKVVAGTISGVLIAAGTITGTNIAATTISGSLLTAGTITFDKIASNTLTSGQIADGTITGQKILSGTISGVLISDNAISASKIQANTITGDKIVANTISGSLITAGTITSTQIATSGITAINIAANAITADNIIGRTITAEKIVLSGITANLLGAEAVTAAALASNSVVSGKVAANAIYGNNIVGGEITGYHVAANTITGDKIRANTISGSLMTAGTITFDKIASNTLTSGQIANGTITGQSILAGTISGVLITDGAISASKIQANTITAGQIAAGTITGTNIAATTISGSLIAGNTITFDKIASNTLTSGQIADGTITGQKILAGTVSGVLITDGTISASKIQANTITFDKIASSTLTSDQIANGTITGRNILAGTVSGVLITNNTISASKIQANTITAGQIAAGTITSTEIATSGITAINIAAGAVTASKLSVSQLDAIAANMGTLTVNSGISIASSGKITAGQTTINNYGVSVGTLANPIVQADLPPINSNVLTIVSSGTSGNLQGIAMFNTAFSTTYPLASLNLDGVSTLEIANNLQNNGGNIHINFADNYTGNFRIYNGNLDMRRAPDTLLDLPPGSIRGYADTVPDTVVYELSPDRVYLGTYAGIPIFNVEASTSKASLTGDLSVSGYITHRKIGGINRTTSQSIPAGSSAQIQLNVADANNVLGNTTSYFITIPEAGYYLINARGSSDSLGVQWQVRAGSTASNNGTVVLANYSQTDFRELNTIITYFSSATNLRMYFYNTGASSISVTGFLRVVRIA